MFFSAAPIFSSTPILKNLLLSKNRSKALKSLSNHSSSTSFLTRNLNSTKIQTIDNISPNITSSIFPLHPIFLYPQTTSFSVNILPSTAQNLSFSCYDLLSNNQNLSLNIKNPPTTNQNSQSLYQNSSTFQHFTTQNLLSSTQKLPSFPQSSFSSCQVLPPTSQNQPCSSTQSLFNFFLPINHQFFAELQAQIFNSSFQLETQTKTLSLANKHDLVPVSTKNVLDVVDKNLVKTKCPTEFIYSSNVFYLL